MNGHPINFSTSSSPERNAKFCPMYGELTISACPACHQFIRGYYHVEGVFAIGPAWEPSAHCYGCGKPYPWTQRRADALNETLDELEELDDAERARLKKAIPDILAETPQSGTAVLRFKKAVAKAGAVGGKVLTDVLAKVAAEAVKGQLGL